MKKLFRKKRVLRALILTMIMVSYITIYNKVFAEHTNIWGIAFVILILNCILIDFVVVRFFKSKRMVKYFYESGVADEGNN